MPLLLLRTRAKGGSFLSMAGEYFTSRMCLSSLDRGGVWAPDQVAGQLGGGGWWHEDMR